LNSCAAFRIMIYINTTRKFLKDFYCVVNTSVGLSHMLSFLVDISKVQDDVVGDGTTSVVVLAAELLRVIRQ